MVQGKHSGFEVPEVIFLEFKTPETMNFSKNISLMGIALQLNLSMIKISHLSVL